MWMILSAFPDQPTVAIVPPHVNSVYNSCGDSEHCGGLSSDWDEDGDEDRCDGDG